jgi:hypothetical protein
LGLSAPPRSKTGREGQFGKVDFSFNHGQPKIDAISRQPPDVDHQAKESDSKVIGEAENAASRISATEAALKPIQPSSSWWPNISLWSKSESAVIKDSTDLRPRIEATKISKDSKEANT